MSKQIQILILTICIYSNAYSQFLALYQKPWNNYFYTLLNQDANNNYRVVNLRGTKTGTFVTRQDQILVYSQAGLIVDSIRMLKNVHPLQEPLKVGSNYYWSCLYNDSITGNSGEQAAYLMKLDLNFTPLEFKKLSYEFNGDYPTNIVSVGTRFYVGLNSNNICKIYKLNSNLEKLDSITFPPAPQDNINEIKSFGNKLMISASNINISGAAKMVLDTSFNILNAFSLTNLNTYTLGTCSGSMTINFVFPYKVIPVSETRYFVAGESDLANSPFPLCDFQWGIINFHMSASNQVLNFHVKKAPLKTVTYMDATNWMDYNFSHMVTVGCIGHKYDSPDLLQGHATQIYVNKTDTMGNIIWEKTHGGDMYYRPMSIKFTTDTGCLIAGIRYDSVNTSYPNIAESFLLRLDKNGNNIFTGIFENGKLNTRYYKCYPNPATEVVYFDIPFQESIEIGIYDVYGKELKVIYDYQNLSEINIRELMAGIYFYKIRLKSETYSGRFIKQ